jgi:glycosyltransferase involved in cell wall biosynthesis
MTQMDLSIIIPVCERAESLMETHKAYLAAMEALSIEWEIIYLFNASTESYFEHFKEQLSSHDRVEAMLLTRSFGEGTAIQVGVEEARGELIMTLPPYQQVEANELHKLIDTIDDHDMVITKRWPRVDGRLNQLQTRLFNGALGIFSNVNYSDIGCGVRLGRNAMMHDMTIDGDQHRFLPVISYENGAAIKEIEITQAKTDAPKRVYKPAVYVRRLLDLLSVIFITKFNKKPLRFFGMLGAGSTLIGLVGLTAITLQRFIWSVPAADRPFLLVSVLFIALGVQLVAIGLVGETIIFTHAKDIKEYRVKKIVNN